MAGKLYILSLSELHFGNVYIYAFLPLQCCQDESPHKYRQPYVFSMWM